MNESDQTNDQKESEGTPRSQRGELQQLQTRAATAALAADAKQRVLRTPPKAIGRRSLLAWPIDTARAISGHVSRLNRLFLWTVVLPTTLSIVYFGFVASDIYVSESSFVVRTPQHESTSGISALLQGTGIVSSQDDVYSVQSYIQSMDAVKELDGAIDLRNAFGSKSIDFVRRFGGLIPGSSIEDLQRYYKFFVVDPQVDSTSSIATLTVRAFSAEGAFRINEMLLNLSEALVNKLNLQAKQDMIGFAQTEVDIAEERAKNARIALGTFRNDKAVIDPEHQAAVQLEELAKLQGDLVSSKSLLAQLQAFAPANPQIPFLRKQISTVEAEINAQTMGVAGAAQGSLAHKASEYDKVEVEREFADKQLELAQAFLEQARNEALQKQLYLERVVQPNRPSTALEPRRFKDVLATFLLSTVVWLVLTLLVSGVREHSD